MIFDIKIFVEVIQILISINFGTPWVRYGPQLVKDPDQVSPRLPLERPRLIPFIATGSSFARVRAGVSAHAHARQPHMMAECSLCAGYSKHSNPIRTRATLQVT